MAQRAIPYIAQEAIRAVVDLVDANIKRRVRLEEEWRMAGKTTTPIGTAVQNLPEA